jgi:hypothetical protein
VSAWLAGDAPDPPRDDFASTMSNRSIWFADQDYASLEELAVGFQTNSQRALVDLFQERDPVLIEEIRAAADEQGRSTLVGLLDRRPSAAEVMPTFVRLLPEMNPRLSPALDGVEFTPQALEGRALEVVNGRASSEQASVLRLVSDNEILRVWRHLPDMGDAARIGQAWKQNLAQVSVPGRALTKDEERKVDAWALLLAINPDYVAEVRSRLGTLDQGAASRQGWWAQLANQGQAMDNVVALCTYEKACADTARDLETQRQTEEAARVQEARRAASHREYLDNENRLAEAARREKAQANRRKAISLLAAAIVALGALLLLGPRLDDSEEEADVVATSEGDDMAEADQTPVTSSDPTTTVTTLPPSPVVFESVLPADTEMGGSWTLSTEPTIAMPYPVGYLDDGASLVRVTDDCSIEPLQYPVCPEEAAVEQVESFDYEVGRIEMAGADGIGQSHTILARSDGTLHGRRSARFQLCDSAGCGITWIVELDVDSSLKFQDYFDCQYVNQVTTSCLDEDYREFKAPANGEYFGDQQADSMMLGLTVG